MLLTEGWRRSNHCAKFNSHAETDKEKLAWIVGKATNVVIYYPDQARYRDLTSDASELLAQRQPVGTGLA